MSQARAAVKKSIWREIWPAVASIGATIVFHTIHMIGVLAAAGASSLAHHVHAHHAHGGGSGGGAGLEWLSWVGWGINGMTALFAAHLLVSYFRHRRTDRHRAASHLTVCLISFVIVFVTIGISL